MSSIKLLSEIDVKPVLEKRMSNIIKLIGEDNFTRELSFAIQAVNSNEYLRKYTSESIAKCIYNLAITGLSLNPVMKLSYLVPRQGEATLMPSYQGIVMLIKDTGSVNNIYAKPVYEGDEFEEIEGTAPQIIHKPKRKTKKLVLVYAVAILPDGSAMQEVMDVEDINTIMSRSEGYRAYKDNKIKSTPWVSDYVEMCRKTVIKRLSKYIPKSNKWNKVQEAIDLDNQEYPATAGQIGYIEALLSVSSYDEDSKDIIRSKASSDLSSAEAEQIIIDLKSNQLDPIASGLNYSQTDIKNHLNGLNG